MIRIKWKETTIRDFKVCDDMYLIENKNKYELVVVQNGKITRRTDLKTQDGYNFMAKHKLYPVDSIIKNYSTCRTIKSNRLVEALLLVGEANMADKPDSTTKPPERT